MLLFSRKIFTSLIRRIAGGSLNDRLLNCVLLFLFFSGVFTSLKKKRFLRLLLGGRNREIEEKFTKWEFRLILTA